MKIPRHIQSNSGMTSREWKAKKRRQVREVLRALDELRLGCAYFPAGSKDVDVAEDALRCIEKDISVKNWGR